MKVSTVLGSLAVAAGSASAVPTTNDTFLQVGTPLGWVDIDDMDYTTQLLANDTDDVGSGNIDKRGGGAEISRSKMGTGTIIWYKPEGVHYYKGTIGLIEWYNADNAPVCEELVEGYPCYHALVKWYPAQAVGKKVKAEGLLKNYHMFYRSSAKGNKRDEEGFAGNDTDEEGTSGGSTAMDTSTLLSGTSPAVSTRGSDALCALVVAMGMLVQLM